MFELTLRTDYQWRSQGGHWAIAQYLKIYCPTIFGDDGYCPALKILTDMWFPKTQSSLAKNFYGLTAHNRTESRLVSDEIFLYFFSTLQ